MRNKKIRVIGAREHNLKNITVEIPVGAFTVVTGPSGSGKSTLALDILFAEGQRRYMESLSSYARQFLGMPKKPDVDRIEGLCPAIAIEQKTVGANPRSTVGTITEIYDYLRVLFARIGTAHCVGCSQKIQPTSPQHIAVLVQENFNKKLITVAAPLALHKKGEFAHLLEKFFDDGYHKFIIDGVRITAQSKDDIKALKLKKTLNHSIDVVIDTLEVSPEEAPRLLDALEKAFNASQGLAKIVVDEQDYVYSSLRTCVTCAYSFPELEPRIFSFNSPLGACGTCHGLGVSLSYTWGTLSESSVRDVESFAVAQPCSTCKGRRLQAAALAVTVGTKNIYELGELSIEDLLTFFNTLELTVDERVIADRLLQEIINRLQFLNNVGLSYLSLNRTARTLSGGEGQRIRLATQIGSALSGVLYVLDEPSIGLHQRDNDRLIDTLKALRDQGNTVIVVEHDHDTMLHADYIIDMGPAAGVLGGSVVAQGTPQEIMANPASLTGAYLSGRSKIVRQGPLRKPKGFLTINNAQAHNLRDITVKFPLGVLCGVSGVSGSGKSSLIMEELVPSIHAALMYKRKALQVSKIEGVELIDNLVVIDQSPIGRTPRSNPATYLGIFDEIRKLFASLPESNVRGYQVGRFSFNVGQGRCSECNGEGNITVSMHFLPDVIMVCSRCKGSRYNAQTLEITYRGKNIAQILAMTAREATEFFAAHTPLYKRLSLMCDVGLDYVQLGQPSTTLSGGEAQRIKLVDELAKRGNKTLYILDEPTTGLHAHDIERLLGVFNRLIDKGNSIIVIEHNLDVLKIADYIIDLGPEGGNKGGYVVAQGTPEQVAQVKASHTGRYLKKILQ
ncbi:MAG: excinuclease ABC subunit UvrA [Candidatus Babeliaceae bacterium]|jgi:excinuclease ABC subunit A